MPEFCEVALPVPLDRTFTYSVPNGQMPVRGSRVIAPFRNEKLIGIVMRVGEKPDVEYEIRPLEAVLDEDDGPLVSGELLSLAEWIAGYYLAPIGEVVRGMLPLVAEVRRTIYYRITDLGRDVLARMLDGEPNLLRSNVAKTKRPRIGAKETDAGELQRRVLERLAVGEPVKVSTLRTATAASLPVLAAMLR
ncbi:MAG TPA: primosomal protein N', partial [Terracidiphilus sp.]